MDSLVVAMELVLAAVFVLAGVAKLADLGGSRQAMRDFGVPASLVRPAAIALPICEIVVALALVVHPTARWGAVAALALLLMFVGGVANAMRQGKDVDCGCFGPIYSATAGSPTLVRNAALAALALVVVVHGSGPAIDEWVGARDAAELAAIGLGIAAVAFGATAWMLGRRLRRTRKVLADQQKLLISAQEAGPPPVDGLPVGTPAPAFSLTGPGGETQSLDLLLAPGLPLVLVFTSPTCGASNKIASDLARWQRSLAEDVTVAILADGGPNAIEEVWGEIEGISLVLDQDNAVADAYNITATPVAVALHPDGRIAGVPFGGASGVEMVIRLAAKRSYPEPDARPPVPAGLRVLQVEPHPA